MASSGKRKTTMAKLSRERRLQERRLDKQARKDARKLASETSPGQPIDAPSGDIDESGDHDGREPELDPVVHTVREA